MLISASLLIGFLVHTLLSLFPRCMCDARNCSRTDCIGIVSLVPEGEPRHHLGRGGGGIVGGTFESHAVSKTCLAIVDTIDDTNDGTDAAYRLHLETAHPLLHS